LLFHGRPLVNGFGSTEAAPRSNLNVVGAALVADEVSNSCRNVRFWHLVDILVTRSNVCFWG